MFQQESSLLTLSRSDGWILCPFLIVLLTSACSHPSEAKAPGEIKANGDIQVDVVAVVKAGIETLARKVDISGEFRPYQVVDVHSKVAGFLKQIKVDVGDRVKAGQVLATLEIPEMRDELAQATAGTGGAIRKYSGYGRKSSARNRTAN